MALLVKWTAPIIFILVLMGLGFMFFSPQGTGDISDVTDTVKKVAGGPTYVDCGTTTSLLSVEKIVLSSLESDTTLQCLDNAVTRCLPAKARLEFKEFNSSFEMIGFVDQSCQYSLSFEQEYQNITGVYSCLITPEQTTGKFATFSLVLAVIDDVQNNPPYITCQKI